MKLFKNLIIISINTIIVKIFGFLKDVILANFFGVNKETDSFFTSFKLINLFRKILAEGAFFQLFVPILVEYKNNKKKNEIQEYIKSILGLLLIITSIATLFCFIFSKQLIKLTNPGLDNLQFCITLKLFNILLPYIIIVSLISLTNSILSVWDIFFVTSITPILTNIITIFMLKYTNNFFSSKINILPISTIIGNFIHLIIQVIYIKYKLFINITPVFCINKNSIEIVKNMIPLGASIFINQLSIMLNTVFTSFLTSGTVSCMYYADKVIELPSGILGMTLNTILFPELSKNINNKKNFSDILSWGLKIGLLLSIPMTLLIIILSKFIIISLFYYGNFSLIDVKMTQEILICNTIGLISIIIYKILLSAFNAYKYNKIILKISLISFFITQLINFFLVYFFKHIGLALSMSINNIINLLFLIYYLFNKNILISNYNWKKFIFKIILASINMLCILFIIMKLIDNNIYKNNIYIRICKLVSLILLGFLLYIISLFYLNINIKKFFISY